jgi:hypothetical protein
MSLRKQYKEFHMKLFVSLLLLVLVLSGCDQPDILAEVVEKTNTPTHEPVKEAVTGGTTISNPIPETTTAAPIIDSRMELQQPFETTSSDGNQVLLYPFTITNPNPFGIWGRYEVTVADPGGVTLRRDSYEARNIGPGEVYQGYYPVFMEHSDSIVTIVPLPPFKQPYGPEFVESTSLIMKSFINPHPGVESVPFVITNTNDREVALSNVEIKAYDTQGRYVWAPGVTGNMPVVLKPMESIQFIIDYLHVPFGLTLETLTYKVRIIERIALR